MSSERGAAPQPSIKSAAHAFFPKLPSKRTERSIDRVLELIKQNGGANMDDLERSLRRYHKAKAKSADPFEHYRGARMPAGV